MITLIAIPNNFVASTTDMVGQIFSDFSGIFTLVIGVVLITSVVSILISRMMK